MFILLQADGYVTVPFKNSWQEKRSLNIRQQNNHSGDRDDMSCACNGTY